MSEVGTQEFGVNKAERTGGEKIKELPKPRQQEALPAETQTESERILKLRRELGLPDTSPLLQTPSPEEKRAMIEEIIEKEKGAIDRNRERMKKKRAEVKNFRSRLSLLPKRLQTEELRKLARVKREIKLAGKGVVQAGEVLSVLEEVESSDWDIDFLLEKNIDFFNLFTPVELRAGIERFDVLGFDFLMGAERRKVLKNDKFRDVFQKLTALDEDAFDKICQSLNRLGSRYSYKRVCENNGDLTENFDAIMHVIDQGGLTPEQNDRIKKAAIVNGLTEYDFDNQERTRNPEEYTMPEFWQILKDSGDGPYFWERAASVVESDVLQSRLREKAGMSSDRPVRRGAHFVDFLVLLHREGKLDRLAALVESPLNLENFIYKYLDHRDDKAMEQAVSDLDKLYEINTKDPDKVSWFMLFEEVYGKDTSSWSQQLRLADFEALYEHRDIMADLAVVLHGVEPTLISCFQRYLNIRPYDEDPFPVGQDLYSFLGEWVRKNLAGDSTTDPESLILKALDKSHWLDANVYSYDAQLGRLRALAEIIAHKRELSEYVSEDLNIGVAWAMAILKGDISLSAESQKYLANYSMHSDQEVVKFVLSHKDQFSEYVVDGHVTVEFCNDYAKRHNYVSTTLLTNEVLESFPEDEREFWGFYRKSIDQRINSFLLDNKDQFGNMVEGGVPTQLYYQLLAEQQPYYFIDKATKDQWKMVFGEEAVNSFLGVLPRTTDERRNAFLHNKYDRTSAFIGYLHRLPNEEFSLTLQDFEILTEFVKNYGLAKSPLLFHYFKYLHLFESREIDELPEDIRKSGIESTQEIAKQLTQIKNIVTREEPLVDLSSLTSFQRGLLEVFTGKSSHRWNTGRPSFDQIAEDFQSSYASDEFAGTPDGYEVMVLESGRVSIEFDTEAIREDYGVLKGEILDSIKNTTEVSDLKEIVAVLMGEKVARIERTLHGAEGKKREFVQKELERFRESITTISQAGSLDELMVAMVKIRFDKSEFDEANSILRRIVFRKLFQRHYSPAFIEDLQMSLEGEITAKSILSVVNIVDHIAKAHVLNLKSQNEADYWTPETLTVLKGTKRGKSLPKIFKPHIQNIRSAVESFERIKEKGSDNMRAIPDRGFVGEMSGYLADACYTSEYPLLKTWQNVVPYKFILGSEDEGGGELFGSVLVFEIDAADDKPSLLVRAFDIPRESEVDIPLLIEQFLDSLVEVAKKRGVTRILIPGDTGAISNYQMTLGHMNSHYITGKDRTSLKDSFAFNGYELKDNCFVAREVEEQKS